MATVLLNKEGRVPEAQIRAGIVSSGGNYQFTSTIASFIASAYRDVLEPRGDAAEVEGQLRRFASGAQGPQEFARDVIQSPEGKAVFAREQYQKLLGRQPTQAGARAAAGAAEPRRDRHRHRLQRRVLPEVTAAPTPPSSSPPRPSSAA